jgi:aspartate dehydrogenase
LKRQTALLIFYRLYFVEPMLMSSSSNPQIRTVAIGGFGAIGQKIAAALDAGIPGLRLVAVSARDVARAQTVMNTYRQPVPVLTLGELAQVADVVVECAPAEVFAALAEPALRAGRTLLVISVGALVARQAHYQALAQAHGASIIVATGALLGLDAVQAAAQGQIHSIRMVTRKPPQGLQGAPYLVANNISVDGLTSPKKVFEGNALDAVIGFPANVNVAAALGLAGVGPENTMIEIWADPSTERNNHTITVDADSASFTLTIANIPSENPKTGRITALSMIAALRKLGSVLRVGT